MTEKNGQAGYDKPRSSPRANAALDVDVEVAGEMRKVRLVTRDIGAGGMFLRTNNPAPLWKKVKLSCTPPGKKPLQIQGEVVRSITPEASASSGFPPGMAIAFDEVSRAKRKDLVALVLDLCSQRPAQKKIDQPKAEKPKADEPKASAPESAKADEPKASAPESAKAGQAKSAPASDSSAREWERRKTDDLLNELDDVLDSVEDEVGSEAEPEDTSELDLELGNNLDVDEPDEAPVIEVDSDEDLKLKTAIRDYRAAVGGDTYYHTLLLDLSAGREQIKAAYQRLLGTLKPPAPPDCLAPETLKELSAVLGRIRKAFAILSKPDRKRAYDFLIDNQVDDL